MQEIEKVIVLLEKIDNKLNLITETANCLQRQIELYEKRYKEQENFFKADIIPNLF